MGPVSETHVSGTLQAPLDISINGIAGVVQFFNRIPAQFMDSFFSVYPAGKVGFGKLLPV